jgi:hypothetical protein
LVHGVGGIAGSMKSIPLVFCLLCLTGCGSEAELKSFRSDGCSLFPDGTPLDKNQWCDCCFEHDLAYWKGGTEEERLRADLELRECVLEKSGSEELADLVFEGVRAGGSPYFYNWYRWGYGWSYSRKYQALSAEELELVEAKLKEFYEDPRFPCE